MSYILEHLSLRHVPSSPGDTRLLHPEHETRHIKDGGDALGVGDLPFLDPPQHLRQRPRHHLDELVPLVRGLAGGEVRRPEEMDPLVGEARRGPDRGHSLEAPRRHAGLLQELAAGARFGTLARREGAGGHFPQETVAGVPELADEENHGIVAAGVGRDRHDGRRAGVADDLELALGAVGEADGVDIHVEDAAGVGAPGGESHGYLVKSSSQVSGTLTPSASRYAAFKRGFAAMGDSGAGEVWGTRPRCRAIRRSRRRWKPSLTSSAARPGRAANHPCTSSSDAYVVAPPGSATTAPGGSPALRR